MRKKKGNQEEAAPSDDTRSCNTDELQCVECKQPVHDDTFHHCIGDMVGTMITSSENMDNYYEKLCEKERELEIAI